MHATALVTLNMRELDRLKMVQAVVETGLKPGRAAERLGLTVRQVERLVARYSMPHRPALPGDSLESAVFLKAAGAVIDRAVRAALADHR